MAKSIIITIGREYGSGGREIAEKLAKELNIPYYDKELITRASEESGIQKGLFEKADEKASRGTMFSLGWAQTAYPGNYMYYNNDMLTNDSLFSIQAETVRRIAAEGSAVIVGRCADYLLDGNPNLLKVFIHADMPFRKRRIMRLYNVPENQVENVIKRTDRQRAKYYDFYTAQTWGEAKNYDISLNSAYFTPDGVVRILVDYAKSILDE